MYSANLQYIETSDNLFSSRTSLKLQLQSSHFSQSNPTEGNRGLTLKCTARIGNLYQQDSEIELAEQVGPLSQRVTSTSSANSWTCYMVFLFFHKLIASIWTHQFINQR